MKRSLIYLVGTGSLVSMFGCGGSVEKANVAALVPGAAAQQDQGGGGQAGGPANDPTNSEPAMGEIAQSEQGSGSGGYGASYGSSEGDNSGAEMSGYGDSSGGYGGAQSGYGEGYGDRSGQGQQNGYGQAGAMAAAPALPPLPPKPAFPDDYRGQAEFAYGHGLETRALQLFLAHLATTPTAAEDFSKAVFIDLHKRPVWSLRWGIGMSVNRAEGYAGSTHPPLENMPKPVEGAPGGQGVGSGGYGGENGSEMSDNPALATLAANTAGKELEENFGAIVKVLGSKFDERYTRGDFGSALANMSARAEVVADAVGGPPQANPSAQRRGPGDGRPPGGIGGQSGPPAGFGGQGSRQSGLEGQSGPPSGYGGESSGSADGGGSEMSSGDGADGYGGSSIMGAGTAAVATMVQSLSLPEPDAPRYRPGLLYVGEGKTEDLLAKAKSIGLHFVVECTAKVSRNRLNAVVQNDTRVRVLDVATGQALATAKFDNVQIYKDFVSPKKKSVNDSVGEQLDPLFKTVDKKISSRAMPSMPKDAVNRRIAILLGSAPEDRLMALAEIRMYQSRGDITEEDFLKALDLLMGVESLVLVAGTTEQQRELLEPFAQRFRSL